MALPYQEDVELRKWAIERAVEIFPSLTGTVSLRATAGRIYNWVLGLDEPEGVLNGSTSH